MNTSRHQELVERIVSTAPPLTPERRDRIARLMARTDER